MIINNLDVREILEQWGMWSRIDVGTGAITAPAEQLINYWIDDDTALIVNEATCRLKKADALLNNTSRAMPRFKAVKLYYIKNYNIPMLANALKCGENKAILTLRSAESFIEANIYQY